MSSTGCVHHKILLDHRPSFGIKIHFSSPACKFYTNQNGQILIIILITVGLTWVVKHQFGNPALNSDENYLIIIFTTLWMQEENSFFRYITMWWLNYYCQVRKEAFPLYVVLSNLVHVSKIKRKYIFSFAVAGKVVNHAIGSRLRFKCVL